MAITTNHHWHNFLDWNELTENEQEEYSENEDAEANYFLRYKEVMLNLGDFMRTESPSLWHGVYTICNTGAVVIRLSKDCEQYQIGTVT